jgi:calnexin
MMMQIGFEIWTMQNDILFDNIYIGHSIEDALKLKAETWDIKHPIEVAEEEATKPKEDKKDVSDLQFKDDPVKYIRTKVDLFVAVAKQDPIGAIKLVPEVAGGVGALILTLVLVVVGAVGLKSPTPAPTPKQATDKGKESASVPKEKAAEAVSTAADNVKAGATKRTAKPAE